MIPCTFCNGHGRPFGHPCPDCSPEYNPEPCSFCDSSATHVNTHTDGTDPVPACSAHAGRRAMPHLYFYGPGYDHAVTASAVYAFRASN